MKRQLQKLVAMLLALILLFGMVPVTALAADPVYDNNPASFQFRLGAQMVESATHYYLIMEKYVGASNYVEIPNTVSVSAAGLTSSQQTELSAAGVSVLDVEEVGFSSDKQTYTHIRLGRNVLRIAESAFSWNIPNLQEVDLPADSRLKTIGWNAFNGSTVTRVGVTGTNALPASVNYIWDYAFYGSNLQSLDLSQTQVSYIEDCTFARSAVQQVLLPPTVTGIALLAFSECAELTALDIPAAVTTLSNRAFYDCENLRSVTFRGEDAVASVGYNSLYGLPEDATVYIPQPDTEEEYTARMNKIYGTMNLNANAKVCWIGSDATVASPAMYNAAAVTLTGAGAPSFTYDFNDTNHDGLGGIVYVDGKESGWTLNINKVLTTSATRATWYVSAAYYDETNGIKDYVNLRGEALTEDMRRHSTIDGWSTEKLSEPLSLSLNDKYTIYYYFPVLINAGNRFTPQRSSFGPPIAVVYRPDGGVGNATPLTLKYAGGGMITVADTALSPDYLTLGEGIDFLLPGVENMGEDGFWNELTPNVTPLDFEGAEVTYQWEIENGGVWSAVPGAAGDAIYTATDEGVLWHCAGMPTSTLDAYRSELALNEFGSKAFRLNVSGTVAGQSVSQMSGVYHLNIYSALNDSKPFTFDTSDLTMWEEENINLSPVFMSYEPGNSRNPYTIKRGTKNVYAIAPYTEETLNGYQGYFTYQWNYYPDGDSSNVTDCGTEPMFDLSLLPDDVATDTKYCVTCDVFLHDEGTNSGWRVKSNHYFYITVKAENARMAWEDGGGVASILRLIFDEEKQSQVQLVNDWEGCDPYADDAVLPVYLEQGMMSGVASARNTIFEVYEVDSPNRNRGGRLLFTTSGWEMYANMDAYTLDNRYTVGSDGWVGSSAGVSAHMHRGTFMIPLMDGGVPFRFDDYGARYVYIRARNEGYLAETDTTTLFSVAYSPTFLILPGNGAVDENAPLPESRMEIVRAPERDVWIAPDTDGDAMETVTLSAKLRLHNMPALYYVDDGQLVGDMAPLAWKIHDPSASDYGSLDNPLNWSNRHDLHGNMDFEKCGTEQRIIVDNITVGADGNYVISCTASIDINLFAPEAAPKQSYLYGGDYELEDGSQGWRVTLQADPYAFIGGGATGGETSADFTLPTRIHLADAGFVPHDMTVSAAGDGAVGGKGVWDSEAGAYVVNPKDARGFDLLSADEYWIYSEEYDYRGPETSGNQPASGDLTFSLPNVDLNTLNANETFVWRVQPEGNTYSFSIAYLEPGDSYELTPADAFGAENWEASYLRASSSGVPTITAETPHGPGNVTRNLELTPMVVTDWDGETKTYTASQTGRTITLRVNRPLRTENPKVSIGGYVSDVYINAEDPGAGLPYRRAVSFYDMQGVTYYRIYRSLGGSANLLNDTPVTGWMTDLSDNGIYWFSLTQEEVDALRDALSGGEGSALYYIAAYNQDDGAPHQTRSDTVTVDVARVHLGSYQIMPTPVAEWEYSGADDVDYIPGNEIPEGFFDITVALPWRAEESQGTALQQIYIESIPIDPNTNNPIESEIRDNNIFNAVKDYATGDVSLTPYSNEHVLYRDNGDGTMTITLTESGMRMFTSIGDALPNFGVNFDLALRWRVRNEEYNTSMPYATGGGAAEWFSRTVTVHQTTVDAATVENVTMDASAEVTGVTIPYGMEGAGTAIPAFRQKSYYYRPVTFDVTADAGLEFRLYLEYWKSGAWHEASVYEPDFYTSDGTQVAPYGTITADGTAQTIRMETRYEENWELSEGSIFFRIRIDASNGDIASTASSYSGVFAMKEATGEEVNAAQPVKGALDTKPLWRVGGPTATTSLTIGADTWTTPSGVLTYQWTRYDENTSTWVEIPGATNPTYTISAAEAADAVAAAATNKLSRTYSIRVTNTDTHSDVTGDREGYSSASFNVQFAKAAEVPIVTLSDASPISMQAGGTPLALSVNVANAAHCGTLTYLWFAKVIDDGEGHLGGYPVDARDESSARIGDSDTLSWVIAGSRFNVYGYDNLNSSYNPYYNALYARLDDLWDVYTGPITVEVWCEVFNTDNRIVNGISSVTAQSARKTVTLSRPSALSAGGVLSADKETLAIDERTTLRLTGVTAPNGGTFEYRWYATKTNVFDDNDYLGYSTQPEYSPYGKNRSDITYYWVQVKERVNSDTLAEAVYGPIAVRTVGERAGAPHLSEANPVYGVPSGTANLSVTAVSPDGGALSYRWETNTGSGWETIVGETLSTLSGAALPVNPGAETRYRVIVTNTNASYPAGKQTNESTMEFTTVACGVALEIPTLPDALTGGSYSAPVKAVWYGPAAPANDEWTMSGTAELTVTPQGSWAPTGGNAYERTALLSGTVTGNVTATLTIAVTPAAGTPIGTPVSASGAVSVTVETVIIEQGSLLLGQYGEAIAMNKRLTARTSLGEASGTWTITSGSLPDGVTYSGGVFTGTPTNPGRYPVTVCFDDTLNTVSREVVLLVQAATYTGGYSSIYATDGEETSLYYDTGASGPGWTWDHELGMLYLDNCNLGRLDIRFYEYTGASYEYAPFWIHVTGDCHVTAAEPFDYGSYFACPLYLIGDGDLTFRAENNAEAMTASVGVVLTAAYSGTLTAERVNNESGYGHSCVYGDIEIQAGSTADLHVILDAPNASGAFALSGDLLHAGSGDVIVTSTAPKASDHRGVNGDVAVSGSGTLTVTADGSLSNVYGIDGSLTHSGSGAVSVTARNAVYGVTAVTRNVTHSGSGELTILAEGNADPGANDAYAVYRGLSASGTGNVSITARNAGRAYGVYGYETPLTIAHTAGTLTLTANGEDTSKAAYDGYNVPRYGTGKTAANYRINGANESASVSYAAADMDDLVITPDGPLAVTITYNTAMAPILFRASGAGTMEWSLAGAPEGLTLTPAEDGLSATLEGAPSEDGSYTATVTVANGTLTDAATVNIAALGTSAAISNTYRLMAKDDLGALYIPSVIAASEEPYFQVTVSGTQPVSYTAESSDTGVLIIDQVEQPHYGAVNVYVRPVATPGNTATITLRGYDGAGGTGNVIVEETISVHIACPSPSAAIINGSWYSDLWVNAHSGSGWSWSPVTGLLTLTNYDGGSIQAQTDGSSDRPLRVLYNGINRVSYISANANQEGAMILESTDGTLCTTAISNLASLRLIGGHVELIDEFSSALVSGMAGAVIFENVKSFTAKNTSGEAGAVALASDVMVSYEMDDPYFVQGAPGESNFAVGTLLAKLSGPDSEYSVTGSNRVTVGESTTLSVPDVQTALSGAYTVYDDNNALLSTTKNATYQWQTRIGAGAWTDLIGATNRTLAVSATSIGEIGDSAQYRCVIAYTDSAFLDSFGATSAAHTLTVASAGVTVSGTVQSFGTAAMGDVTVRLMQGATEVAQTTAAAGGSYSFEGVAAGDYTLAFDKTNHVTRECDITVDSTPVEENAKICLNGDVSGDGKILSNDSTLMLHHIRGTTPLGEYQIECGDLTGDGKVLANDKAILMHHIRGTTLLW